VIDIYPRLTTTVTAGQYRVGPYPAFRYNVVNVLYQSIHDVEPLTPLSPVTVVQEEQHRHIAVPLKDMVGHVRFAIPRDTAEITAGFRTIGEWIAENLLPTKCVSCCHDNKFPHTIEFITERQDIPWELTWLGDDFLARKVIHARYPFVSRIRHRALSYPAAPSLAIVVGRSLGLFDSRVEIEGIQQLYKDTFGANVKVFQGEAVTVDLLRNILTGIAGTFDIIHYIGHGDSEGDQVWLELLGPPFLDHNVPPNVYGNPLVFWNSCFSGAAAASCRYQSDVVDGFGGRLLSSGASHFIGPLFPVPDSTAAEFALKFYASIFAGDSVGFSFFQAKTAICEADPVALTYVLYGNPGVRMISHA